MLHLSIVKKLIREVEVEPKTPPPVGLRESWARVADFHLQKFEMILRLFYFHFGTPSLRSCVGPSRAGKVLQNSIMIKEELDSGVEQERWYGR